MSQPITPLTGFEQFPAPLNDLNAFLKRHQAVVTGSFAVRHLLQESWSCDDIDVVFPHRAGFAAELEKAGWTYVPRENKKYEADFYAERLPVSANYHWTHPELAGVTLNVIQFENTRILTDVHNVIDDNFDLSGCTVRWDGSAWHIAGDISWADFFAKKWHFRSQLLERLATKSLKYVKRDAEITKYRLQKYKERGVSIDNADDIISKYPKLILQVELSQLSLEERQLIQNLAQTREKLKKLEVRKLAVSAQIV
jgi:hypothetical protein